MNYWEEIKNLPSVTKLTDEMINNAIVSRGNCSRIKAAMKKAMSGENITVGAIGGSITMGCNSSRADNCYAGLVARWWQERFPQSKIKFVNAGIGSTNSVIGVYRLEKDLLKENPDFSIVEFAVNDINDGDWDEGGNYTRFDPCGDKYSACYEAIIRRLLENADTAVMLLFMTTLGLKGPTGSQEAIQTKIGCHYNLPMISCANSFWQGVVDGSFPWEDFAGKDNTHPNTSGHAAVAVLVINLLEKIYSQLDIEESAYELPLPFNSDALDFMNGKFYNPTNCTPDSLGDWKASDNAFTHFKNGWIADGTKPLVISFKDVKCVKLLTKIAVNENIGEALVRAGGYRTVINSDFPNGWGAYPWQTTVFESKEPQDITLEISVTDKDKIFAVLGIFVS